ncbi:FO synthase subunit 1 [Durusdinium trenchii]|uniref:FO synthase subunit 1 n=1 Tax=Durusdinium trenchii TaxID=1381693 RepID=A0ABP0QEQ7_9DINO
MPVACTVDALSSDSAEDFLPAAPKEPSRKRRRMKTLANAQLAQKDPSSSLRSLIGRECSCKRKICFQQFVADQDFQPLLEYRKHFFDLHKLDQDSYAFDRVRDILRDHETQQGSKRLTRMYNAAENGKESAPVDLRFIKKPMSLVGVSAASARADVISYLTNVYESIAESLPDVRDTLYDGVDPEEIPVFGSSQPVDVYSIELKRQADASAGKISKPRKKKKSVEMNMERTHGEAAKEVKWCKQWMNSPSYNLTVLLYPRQVGLELMRVGLPQGLAEKREIAEEQRSHLQKYIPMLRFPLYNLSRCADFLESWLNDALPTKLYGYLWQQLLLVMLEQSVVPVGPDVWLSNEFKTEESCWLRYATDTTGPQYLRPWMLAWRADSGCSGYIEPDQLALLFVERIMMDYDSSHPALRKAVSYQVAVSRHQACGLFLHFLREFQKSSPASDFQKASSELRRGFLQGLLDPDLQHCLSTTVPPSDLHSISACRPYVARVEQVVKAAKEEKTAKLAEEARAADAKQIVAKIQSDFQATLVKHRHALDLLLLNAGLTVYHHIQLCYEKPDSSARDNRSLSQLAVAVFHANFDNCAWMDSSAVKEGRLGPIPLIRVADFIGYDDVKRPSASARVEQFVEFARAMTERSLERQKTDVRYFGFAPSDSFKDTLAAVRDMIYKSWDVSKESPPKQRPGSDAAEQAAPDLQILAWNGRPVFPECVASRFEEGTLEFDEVAKLKKEFLEMFPHATTQPAAPNPVPARVGGVCDFTLDNGAEPLDVNREIEVERIADDQFSEQRTLYPMCQFMRKLATEQGIGQLAIEDHSLSQRFHAVADGAADPVPVSFRYQIAPLPSKSTHVYKPNGMGERAENVAANMVGAAFGGNYNKVVNNKRASVVWEATRWSLIWQFTFHEYRKQ